MDFARYFQRDPKICGGETVITGTRVTLRAVLASLAFAAATAKEDLPLLAAPTLE
jgi:uncharacterized protein (DUF433 family)